MADISTTYTFNQGDNTPQGGQYQTGLNLFNLQNQVNNGQPLDTNTTNAVNQSILTAGQSQANISNPQSRQADLAATGIGQLQTQTDDLIQRLAGYDQAVLKPQFQGTDPGLSPDMPTSNFVTNSGITALTPQNAALNSTSGIFNSNPIYGFTAQQNQGNNFLDLLGTLNNAMKTEYERGKAKYSTQTGDIARVLGLLTDLQKSNNSLAESRLTASSKFKDPTPLQLRQYLAGELQKVWGKDHHVSPTDYNQIKGIGSLLGVDTPNFDSWFRQYRNPDQATLFPNDTYEIDPAALTSQERIAIQKGVDSKNTYNMVASSIQGLLDQYQKLSPFEKNPLTGDLMKLNQYSGSAEYEKQKKALAATLKDLAGAGAGSGVRVNQAELNNWASLLPRGGETPSQAKTNVTTLQNALLAKFGKGLDQSYLDQYGITSPEPTPGGTTVMTGPGGTFNVPNNKIDLFKQNGYK